jgi:hypothetical protein
MYELRSLWLPTLRFIAAAALSFLLAMAPDSPLAAQTSSGGGGGSTSTGSGSDVTSTDEEEEDIDEWENDILKSTTTPAPGGGLADLVDVVLRSLGFRVSQLSADQAGSVGLLHR